MCSPSADIDDMHICYVLRDGDNATSDAFHFSIEDNGKLFQLLFTIFASGCLKYDYSWITEVCIPICIILPFFVCLRRACEGVTAIAITRICTI